MAERSRADRVWDCVTAHASTVGAPVSVCVVCAAAAERLPVDGATVVVQSHDVASEVLCATSSVSRDMEELQLTLGEGPALEVLAGGSSVSIEELDAQRHRDRWPMFIPLALQVGVRALYVLPLRSGGLRFGALSLWRKGPGWLSAEDLAEARLFAEIALDLLLDEVAGIDTSRDGYRGDGLSGGRPEVHQAVGMITVQMGGVGVREAFVRLRARAFAEDRRLSEVAADVVARRVRFDDEDMAL